MVIQIRVSDPTGTGIGTIFYSRVAPIPDLRLVRNVYFFLPVCNSTGTRYFTTVIILGSEQVKMCSFYYINYDLF
jgi:hypothetical protein